jgi:hypothetical protein
MEWISGGREHGTWDIEEGLLSEYPLDAFQLTRSRLN